jgi:DnaJ-class molecular chaperone
MAEGARTAGAERQGCRVCDGTGFLVALIGGSQLPPSVPCSRCNGTGVESLPVSPGPEGGEQ